MKQIKNQIKLYNFESVILDSKKDNLNS